MRRLAELALFTEDVQSATAFYRCVLDSEPVETWPGGAVFTAGDVKLLVHERGDGLEGGPPNEDHVAVSVPDLDAACMSLREQGLTLLVEPHDYYWGRSAYLRDADGRLVELTQG